MLLWFDGAGTQREVTDGHKAPVGPVYEEVGPALPPREMDIELQSNQAYGEVTRVHVY